MTTTDQDVARASIPVPQPERELNALVHRLGQALELAQSFLAAHPVAGCPCQWCNEDENSEQLVEDVAGIAWLVPDFISHLEDNIRLSPERNGDGGDDAEEEEAEADPPAVAETWRDRPPLA